MPGYMTMFRPCSFILMCSALSAQGQVNFMKSYGGPDTEVCNDLVLRADGSIAMVGETQTAAYVFGSSDGFLLRSDLNGVIINAAASGAIQTDAYTSVEALPDSGLFAVGYTSTMAGDRFDLSIESYVKTLHDVVDFIDGADVVLNKRLETVLL